MTLDEERKAISYQPSAVSEDEDERRESHSREREAEKRSSKADDTIAA